MYKIGVDIGSTFTKYCILEDSGLDEVLFTERSPIRQEMYFSQKLKELKEKYPDSRICTCGYGKNNLSSDKSVNELIALARGASHICHDITSVLDIGGQDTKIISIADRRLNKFFVNDKCAAGCGLFLMDVCNLLDTTIGSIDLSDGKKPDITLSSVCAVFARSEIVRLISENVPPEVIIRAAVWQILIKARPLLGKLSDTSSVLLSGGLSNLKGISVFASLALEKECFILPRYSSYLSAIGCSIIA